ncbi:ArsR/SmtB family transcription factor [Methanobacterium spitsbergense]|uniref:Winged helix-turn-helix domain-containing protein n=1 Tax=Methanobacterium spitsbergense TaxID=2874285 RepID=A0A8T5UVY9_9EURY|nr:winged helix-turn-helix domain-containing protein [Methanobacterium spitsbergense]MBZ2166417.1 winged helix-turn-helix domain-containing protein [Methanobacterium spitsbergense]
MKRILWYLIAGSRGGTNRARIIEALHDRPYNVNQLSLELDLDYKTIQHHIKILKDHNILVNSSGEKKYGEMIFLTNRMEENYPIFLEIQSKMKK